MTRLNRVKRIRVETFNDSGRKEGREGERTCITNILRAINTIFFSNKVLNSKYQKKNVQCGYFNNNNNNNDKVTRTKNGLTWLDPLRTDLPLDPATMEH